MASTASASSSAKSLANSLLHRKNHTMKNIRAAVVLFLLAVFLAAGAEANTSSINPNVPAQNSPLSSSVLRGNFGNAYTDENTIYGIFALSSNQLLGTVNAGNAGPLNLPTCSTGALSWTPGTGFGCNSLSGLVSPITQSLVFTGQIGISLNATALPTKQVGTVLQLANADTIASRLENDAFAATAYFTGVRSDGTNAAPTTLQNLDEISGINAWGYNGSSIVGPRASVREFAAQNWTGSAQGTRVDIATTLNNTTTMSPVCGFENDGGVTCPPTVTGGDQGAGKINAAGLFVNGVAVSTGSNAFSSITAAIANNSVENAAFTQTWAWDGVTTQTAMLHTSTSITTGQLANFSIANAASTGYAGYFSNTGTAIAYGVYATEAGAANTGYAGYFNNTATATGYALYANGSATVNGNLTVTGTCTGCGGGSVTAVTFANTTTGSPAAGFTGIHQRAANSMSLSTTGADALTITNTGSVGIGTTTPASPLVVSGFGSNNATLVVTGAATFGTAFLLDSSATTGGDQWQITSSNTAGGCLHCIYFYDNTANSGSGDGALAIYTTGTALSEVVGNVNLVYGWNTNNQFLANTLDTGISRDSAGVIDIGTGGVKSKAGSINLTGLTASGSITDTGITTDATHTDATVCEDTTSHQFYFGSGTAGICLGTSSARYKHDIVPMGDVIAQLESLRPVTFYYKKGYGDDGAKQQGGFLAEDMFKVFPKLVDLDKDGQPNAVDLMGLVPVLVHAVQEQQKEISGLKKQLAAFHREKSSR
jgi:Chaperone of endosialidase